MTEKMNEGTAIGIQGPIGPDADEMIDSVVKELLKIAEATKKALKEVEETEERVCDAESRVVHDSPYEETEGERVCDAESRVVHNSPYEETVEGMLSADYRKRFKAEYRQTKIRYEKLKSFCNRIEASMRTCPGDTKRVQMPEHDCPLDLLRDQQRAMGEYLHCLEIRAVIEGIDL